MRLESAEHHRADPNRAQSRILVQAASAPNRGDRTVRFPVVMAGSRVSLFSLAAHINRSFRNDVNAGVIPFGERTAIKVSSSASKFGRRMDQPDSAHLTTRRDFLRRPLRRHCARQPTRDAVPAADRKVSKNRIYVLRPSVAKPHAVQRTNAMVALQAFRSWA